MLGGAEFLPGSLLQVSRHQVSQDHLSSGTEARHAKGVWESGMERFATPGCKLASRGRTWNSTLMSATEQMERLAENLSYSEFTTILPPLPSRRGALGNPRKFGREPVLLSQGTEKM